MKILSNKFIIMNYLVTKSQIYLICLPKCIFVIKKLQFQKKLLYTNIGIQI